MKRGRFQSTSRRPRMGAANIDASMFMRKISSECPGKIVHRCQALIAGIVIGAASVALVVPVGALAQGIGGTPGGIDSGEGSSSGLPAAGTGVRNPGSIDPADPGAGSGGGGDDDKAKSQAPPPPPALPGSHAHPTEVVPADKVVADMEPTAALFDAINRGDTVAARDAINRGASLDGRNVLGLTPIELSVDLNRNDISFLLLSMRGAVATASGNSKPLHAAAQAVPVSARGFPTRRPAPAPVAVPDAGFLGFGPRPGL